MRQDWTKPKQGYNIWRGVLMQRGRHFPMCLLQQTPCSLHTICVWLYKKTLLKISEKLCRTKSQRDHKLLLSCTEFNKHKHVYSISPASRPKRFGEELFPSPKLFMRIFQVPTPFSKSATTFTHFPFFSFKSCEARFCGVFTPNVLPPNFWSNVPLRAMNDISWFSKQSCCLAQVLFHKS